MLSVCPDMAEAVPGMAAPQRSENRAPRLAAVAGGRSKQ